MSLLQPLLSTFPESWTDERAEILERHERHARKEQSARHVQQAPESRERVQARVPAPAATPGSEARLVRKAPRGAFSAARVSAQSPVAAWDERGQRSSAQAKSGVASRATYTRPKALPWGVVNDRQAWLNLGRPFAELL